MSSSFVVSDALRDSVTSLFAERIQANKAPGSCYAVFDANGILFGNGAGRRNQMGDSPDTTTRFRIASCTKSFTAAAVLLLRDRGLVSLDTPITAYVPELAWGQPGATFISPSIRMLLMMKGGLFKDDPWADRMESCSRDELLAVLKQGVRFVSTPGERYEYSNLGYALLGQVVEQVTGKPYWQFVEEALLAPLGLTASGFDYRLMPEADVATGYRHDAQQWLPLPMATPGGFSSIGGLITNAHDLAAWNRWLMQGYIPDVNESGPLSKASRREMQHLQALISSGSGPVTEASITGYGYGLMREEHANQPVVIGHSGGYPGFSAYMCWCPAAQLGVLGFENATYAGVAVAVKAAMQEIIKAWQHQSPTHDVPPVPADVQTLATALLTQLQYWDQVRLEALCLPNVALDIPFEERQQQWEALLQQAGTVQWSQARLQPKGHNDGFERFIWRIPCDQGYLLCRAQLGPPEPPRLQAFSISFKGSEED